MKWYSIGAFTFPSVWGAVVIAFAVTGIFLKLYDGKQANEWFGNSVFWFILTWKLSFILFDFSAFIRQPLSVIYYYGGVKGFWLGIAMALIYIFLKGKREHLFGSWILFVLVYEGAAGYLADNTSLLDAGNLLVGLGLFYLVLKMGKKEIWLLVFTGIQLLVNFLQSGWFSTESFAYVVITIGVLVVNRFGRDAHE
ncbi:hypothetical protein [Bacillus sp. AK031]